MNYSYTETFSNDNDNEEDFDETSYNFTTKFTTE